MTRSWSLAVGTPLLLALLLVPAPPARASDTGPWVAPVPVVDVVRAFDPPRTAYGAGHRGVDLRAAPGTVVRAAGAGRVSYASVLAGRGVVVVLHGALRTTYEPVSATVSAGEQVGVGDPLGTLDAAHPGCAPAACLHWGLRRGEAYLDPLRLLRRRPSVLLPLTAADRALTSPTLRVAGPVAPAARPVGRRFVAAPLAPAVGASTEASPALPARVRAVPAAGDAGWSLRSADLPLGAGALLALLAGLALLTRRSRSGPTPDPSPDPDPDDPPVAPALGLTLRLPPDLNAGRADHGVVAAPPRSGRPDNSMIGGEGGGIREDVRVPAPVDLGAERLRRRAA